MKEKEIFYQALARGHSEERAAYLERAYAGDPALRVLVEALPRANVSASGFLDRPAPVPVATIEQQPANGRQSAVIGLDRLLVQIGEGDMGMVWMAQQTESVNRLVALRLIKAGMASPRSSPVARSSANRRIAGSTGTTVGNDRTS